MALGLLDAHGTALSGGLDRGQRGLERGPAILERAADGAVGSEGIEEMAPLVAVRAPEVTASPQVPHPGRQGPKDLRNPARPRHQAGRIATRGIEGQAFDANTGNPEPSGGAADLELDVLGGPLGEHGRAEHPVVEGRAHDGRLIVPPPRPASREDLGDIAGGQETPEIEVIERGFDECPSAPGAPLSPRRKIRVVPRAVPHGSDAFELAQNTSVDDRLRLAHQTTTP